MKILVTGAAGFIGFHLSKRLLEEGHSVIGLDNINNYYDTGLKYARLTELGIDKVAVDTYGSMVRSTLYSELGFINIDIADREALPKLFDGEEFGIVCNLAAQAGVRYSLENPEAYIDSNIVGFANLLECCRNHEIEHLVYASSSSVYGLNKEIPFKVTDSVDHPISLYAASKKSNELMAHTYSHLFGLRTTGLRFFTVYGPWGRPDMAMFLFTKAILEGKPIQVFNNGNLERDFTYIDDIIEGVNRIINDVHTKEYDKDTLYNIYNIGNNKSIKLLEFIKAIEERLGRKSKKVMLEMQPGDVEKTWANVDSLIRDYNYKPITSIQDGVSSTIDWYFKYYVDE